LLSFAEHPDVVQTDRRIVRPSQPTIDHDAGRGGGGGAPSPRTGLDAALRRDCGNRAVGLAEEQHCNPQNTNTWSERPTEALEKRGKKRHKHPHTPHQQRKQRTSCRRGADEISNGADIPSLSKPPRIQTKFSSSQRDTKTSLPFLFPPPPPLRLRHHCACRPSVTRSRPLASGSSADHSRRRSAFAPNGICDWGSIVKYRFRPIVRSA